MRPASGIQLVVRNGASVLVWSVGRQVFRSHTGGVLKRQGIQKKKRRRSRKGREWEMTRKEKRMKRRQGNDGQTKINACR